MVQRVWIIEVDWWKTGTWQPFPRACYPTRDEARQRRDVIKETWPKCGRFRVRPYVPKER